MMADFQPPWSDDALDAQWVKVRRLFIRRGGLADLWRADGGLGVSVLPVALLLSRGYPAGVSVSRERLSWLAGVSTRSAALAMRTLSNAGVVALIPHSSRSTIRFVPTPEALREPGSLAHCFVFRGLVLSSGIWRRLPRTARTVALALGGASGSRLEYEDIQRGVWDDLAGGVPGGVPSTPLHQVGMTTCAELAALTGLDRSSVSRGLASVHATRVAPFSEPLAYVRTTKEGTIYQLPASWWAL